MATIVIKDLTESIDLDRQAMQAITGGARVRGRSAPVGSTIVRSERIIKYPACFGASPRSGGTEAPGKRHGHD